jgi:hypothetical protein
MSGYLQPEPFTYINIKLTDEGRKKLSLGQLNFAKAVISDREINYGIDNLNLYDITCCNRVLAPKDDQPSISLNYDGSLPLNLQSVGSATQYATAMTQSTGFFTGATNGWGIKESLSLGYSVISYSSQTPNGGTTIQMTGGTHFPNADELMFVMWKPVQNSASTYSGNVILSANPSVCLWYRVLSASTGTSTVTLDRPLPNFGTTVLASQQQVNAYFYPYNGIQNYYGSAMTVDVSVWNMNIVRTSSEIGTTNSMSGYVSYGSIEYNGTKQYLGFSSETKNFGVIHYTNSFTGNTYAEELLPGTVQLDIPYIMWHRYPANTGQAVPWGLTLTDTYGPTVFDNAAQTTFRPLRDGNSANSLVVGRVYHKLKIIVITDQELLTALTYKSNRNYTLPRVELDSTVVPKFPLSTVDATGIMQTGYTYYVTYITESEPSYTSGLTYGYPVSTPCTYYNKIDGVNDINGDPQYLRVNFPSNAFPYMRSYIGMDTYSGTGWNANKVQLLVNKVDTTLYPYNQPGNIPTDNWRLISNVVGNGIYSGGSSTIDPLQLQGFSYVISQEDYNSGTTYSLTGAYSGFNQNSSLLTYGDEYMYYGNIKAGIKATVFKTVITVVLPNNQFNSTLNKSFDPVYNTNIYITEIDVLDNAGKVVAVGKPTVPITKNVNNYLAIQLEIDF